MLPASAPFGTITDGTAVQLFTLRNAQGAQGAQATITNDGGTLISLQVPGRLGHVVLDFDEVSGYQSAAFRQTTPYLGALIGRFGNRIARGRFELDGQRHQLPINNGPNLLHGGARFRPAGVAGPARYFARRSHAHAQLPEPGWGAGPPRNPARDGGLHAHGRQ